MLFVVSRAVFTESGVSAAFLCDSAETQAPAFTDVMDGVGHDRNANILPTKISAKIKNASNICNFF